MSEIAVQLKPINEKIDLLSKVLANFSEWKRSLYSNGSGGPPGYIEILASNLNSRMDRLSNQVEALNQDGMRREGVKEYMGERREKDKGHHSRVLMWVGVVTCIVGVIMMLMAIGGFILNARVHSGEVTLPKISQSEAPQTTAYLQEDATVPANLSRDADTER